MTERSPTSRRWRELVKRVLPTAPRVRRVPLGIGRGLRMRIDFARQSMYYFGVHEIELNRHLRLLCRPGSNAFDVGCEVGYDSLVIARLTGGKVLSFDADPSVSQRFKENVLANPSLASQIEFRCGRVGASVDDETTTIDQASRSPGGFVPDMIKIDVEGAELDVLRGADSVLREGRPGLLIETHSAALESACLELLRRLGYAPVCVNPRRWLREPRSMSHNRWIVAQRPKQDPVSR